MSVQRHRNTAAPRAGELGVGALVALLSVRIRSRGGTAFFLDKCFGTAIAGPLNVLLWLSYFVMLGLYAVAFGSYSAALVGEVPDGPWRRGLASAVVLVFAALNLADARIVGRAEVFLVYGKLAILMLFCIVGLAFVDGGRVSPAHYPSFGVIVYAGALIFLGYEGFELIANAAEDARDPRRSLPLAYLISIGVVIGLYVLVAFVAVGNLDIAQIDHDRDYALAAAARPFLGSAGFILIGIAAVISTASAINATLYGTGKFTYLMARNGELPAALGKPVWDRPIGGLLATTAGTLVVVNGVDIQGISLIGSAGFLLIFAAVNLAVLRLRAGRATKLLAITGAVACLGSFGAMTAYAATKMPEHLWVLVGFLLGAIVVEGLVRMRGRQASHPGLPPTYG
ncbi:Inner membrane transport protein YbaT [Mycobacterium basiliense]|uniref:Inner membrane transport protein YbaT n=1 Tax=Mycobacterium basiliense TaxID=2094119 RepID=A0A447GED3_9MYCO|nr:APC family permease [Mycobacterium basiliense]VDM88815.1 Inner membrane transport protein YbaT [Mycobacterium basiliense]